MLDCGCYASPVRELYFQNNTKKGFRACQADLRKFVFADEMRKANSGVTAALQKIITSQGKGAGNTDKFDVPKVD